MLEEVPDQTLDPKSSKELVTAGGTLMKAYFCFHLPFRQHHFIQGRARLEKITRSTGWSSRKEKIRKINELHPDSLLHQKKKEMKVKKTVIKTSDRPGAYYL